MPAGISSAIAYAWVAPSSTYNERAHEAVRERAVGELVGVALGRKAGLDADPGL
jgi:hypothetical protein